MNIRTLVLDTSLPGVSSYYPHGIHFQGVMLHYPFTNEETKRVCYLSGLTDPVTSEPRPSSDLWLEIQHRFHQTLLQLTKSGIFSMMAFSKEGRHRMRVTVRDIAQKFEDIEYLGIRKSRCTVKDRSFQVEGQGDLNSRKKWIRYLILVSYLRQASYLSFGENHYSNRLVVYEIQYMTSYMSLPLTKLFNPECRACSALNCKIGMIVSQCVCEESVS